MSMQRVQSVTDAQALALLKATGASMVCAGTKTTGGVDTKRPALVVAVPSKRPLEDIPPGERVPSKVAGVVTDVIELPMPRAHPRRNSLESAPLGCDRAIERHRPLTGGISMFHARWDWARGVAGTLGAIVRDATDGALVGLSNNHCLGLAHVPGYGIPWYSENDPAQIPVIQPAGADLGSLAADRIGTVKRAIPLAFAQATSTTHPGGIPTIYTPNPAAVLTYDAPANKVDAALIALDPGIEAGWGMLEISPGPFPFADKSEVTLGMPIYKAGRTTGRVPPALGIISSLAVTHATDHSDNYQRLPGWERDTYPPIAETLTAYMTGQMLFTPSTPGHVTALAGDSGSVVLGLIGGVFKIVGLYHAGVDGAYGFFTPIWTVASLLGIEAYTDVLAPPAAGQRTFFGVACAPGAAVIPVAPMTEASPGTPSPVTVPPATAPATGDVTHAVAHRGDVQQVLAEVYSLTHGPALLRLGTWPESPAAQRFASGLVFEHLVIPQGATVTSAVLECTVHRDPFHDRRPFNAAGSLVLTLRAVATNDGWRPRTYDPDWAAATLTTASVVWTIPAGPPGEVECPAPGDVLTSPNLATVLNEILARPGWLPGHGLVLQLADSSDGNVSLACAGPGPDAPRLRVVWG